MTNKEKQQFFIIINDVVDKILKDQKEINLTKLILKLGLEHGYGDVSIKRRLKIHEELKQIKIEDGYIIPMVKQNDE